MKFKQYSEMKNSGVDWIDQIPKNWNIKRLKFVTKFDLSTVDRHEYDDEIQVSICHYPQVYNNEIISSNTELSQGTCSEKELEKFRLKKDDVLITKDSETRAEIGVPAYIEDNFQNTVCGYHLAQLSSDKNQILGDFLFRYLQSDFANAYFETESTGITRYGLDKNSINNLRILLPSISEQKLILEFLREKLSIIIKQMSNHQKLIELLEEKKQSIVHQAVTKGLDHTIKMKNSGVDWIGEIPDTWDIVRLRFLADIKTGQKNLVDNEQHGAYPFFVRSQNVEQISTYSCDEEAVLTAGDGVGVGKVFHYVDGKFDFHQRVYKMSNFRKISGKYFYYYFKENFRKEVFKGTAKSTVDSLRRHMLQDFLIVFGSKIEQEQIVSYLENQIINIDSLISKIKLQLIKYDEYKKSLVSNSVTGKIIVR